MITFDLEQSRVPPEHRLTRQRLAKLAASLDRRLRTKPQGQVAISFVTDHEIRRLNRMYRSKDAVTDVLSFAAPADDLSGQLGDVLVSYDQAVRQAEDADIELELADLVVHGVLHVLGFDHEQPADAEVMFPLQDNIVADIL